MEKKTELFNALFNARSGADSLGNGRLPEGFNPQSVTTAPRNWGLCVPRK